MAKLIRFIYRPGESLLHETVITSVFKNIDGEKSEKKMRLRITTECLRLRGEDYVCRSRTHLLEAEGLKAEPSQLVPGPWAGFTQSPSGKILAQDNPSVPVTADLIFPLCEVDVDDYWEVEDQGDKSSPMTMEVQIDELEQRENELVAILSCGGQAEVDEGTASAFIEGTIHFSVTRGRRLWSKILCSLSWQSGRKVDSVEETTYLGQG